MASMHISKSDVESIKSSMEVFNDNWRSISEAVGIAMNNPLYDEVEGNANLALDAILEIVEIIQENIE